MAEQNFRDALAKMVRDLDREEGIEPTALAQLAARFATIRQHVPYEDAERVTAKLIEITGRPADWFDRVWRLPIPEIRRAVTTRPVLLNRLAHETLYPTGGWIGGYLLYTQESEAPLGWHFWCAVSLLSLVARRTFYYDRGRYFLFLNHYIFLLGQSGLTKSTTVGQALGIFDEVQEIIAGMNGGVEPFYQSPERITPERMLADLSNWTFSVTGPGRRDTVLYVVSDELSTLLGREIKGSDRLANFLTDIYMGKRTFRDSTIVGGDRKLTNVICTCLFASTASAVRRAITEAMFSEGFMARVITAPRKLDDRHGTYDTPPPTDPVQRRILAESIVPLAMLDSEIELRPTREAREWFSEWYVRHRETPPSDEKLVAFWQRKPDHVNRLAGILLLSDIAGNPDPKAALEEIRDEGILHISEKYLEHALRIIEDEERRLPDAFSMIGAKEEAREMWQLQGVIERHWREKHEPIAHVDLFHNCRHLIKDAPHMMLMLQTLMQMELVEMVRVGGKVKAYYRPTNKGVPSDNTASPDTAAEERSAPEN